jgi:hypothetical protein
MESIEDIFKRKFSTETPRNFDEIISNLIRKLKDLKIISLPENLAELIGKSLKTPQISAYHQEGPTLAYHIEEMLRAIEEVREGKYNFDLLQVPANLKEETKNMIIETAKRYSEELKLFAFLHDLGKAECLVLQNSKALNELRRLSKEERERRIKAIREELKQIRGQHLLKQSLKEQVELPPVYLLSLEEWEEILRELGDDIDSALQFLLRHYDKTFFRKEKEYFEEERDHGGESVVLVRKALLESQIQLSEDEQKTLDLILKIIENHEVHFQVFTTTRSAKNYETHIKSRFEEDEINLFYTACFIDIAASLGDDKKPNFQGFANMVIAKKNYELIQSSGLTDENKRNLMNLDILPEELEKRIEEFKKKEKLDQALKEHKLTEEDIEEVFAKLNLPDDIKEGLKSLIDKNFSEALGYLDRTLPPNLKRFLGGIRKIISERLERELELLNN